MAINITPEAQPASGLVNMVYKPDDAVAEDYTNVLRDCQFLKAQRRNVIDLRRYSVGATVMVVTATALLVTNSIFGYVGAFYFLVAAVLFINASRKTGNDILAALKYEREERRNTQATLARLHFSRAGETGGEEAIAPPVKKPVDKHVLFIRPKDRKPNPDGAA